MSFLSSVKNLLMFLYEHWADIVAILGVCFVLFRRVKSFISKSDEEKIAIVKEQIKTNMLKYVTDAEEDYADWVKAGEIKRSQVIQRIYMEYPILSKIIVQDELIVWLDKTINDALKTMRKIIEAQEINETKAE